MSHGTLRSMTGFGRAEGATQGGRLRAEVRTVNHRFLNLQIRTPSGFEVLQGELDRLLRSVFSRGHVSLTLTLERDEVAGTDTPGAIGVDLDRARGALAALRTVRDELGLEDAVELTHLLHFRDLFPPPDRERETQVEPAIEDVGPVVRAAAEEALAMRVEEGERLADDLRGRLRAMESEVEAIEAAAPGRLVRERDRLREQIARLLPDGVPVDEERIAREIAHLAERWDIHEEVVRFRSHLEMFRATLGDGSPDGVGKRLGFIVQEILREANTMGSKANDAEIARAVVKLKEEIERLREQLENVE
jgi:uncharacterized protein (TIGR00255 family)